MTNKGSKVVLSFLFAALLMFAKFAIGQATTAGQLTGTVVDPAGSVIPGAMLTLSRPSTGFTQNATANASGSYTLSNLQAGTYQLDVTAKGFAAAHYDDVNIDIGRISNLKILMKIGAASQTVKVSAAGEVLETTTNTLSTTISPDAVQDLPLNGRDTLPFAQLVQGAQSGGDTRFTTYNALPNAAINITVDGMNDNFQRYRTSTTGFFTAAPVRLGAVDEVSVSTGDLTADAGAEGAVTLRFQLKRGTNKFHGNAFWQTQNSAFNANTYENNALGERKQPYHLNDYGGSLGGPFWRNKLFFFFNYEQEFVPGETLGSNYVLTQAAQSGDFTYTGTDGAQHTVNVLNIAANNGLPSSVNSVIANQFAGINKYVASPGTNTQATILPYENEVFWNYGNENKNIYPTARVDYQITPKIEFNVAYNLYWRTYSPNYIYPNDPNTNNAFRSSYSTFTSGINWTITQNLLNQVHFGLLNTQEEFNAGNSFNPFTGENNINIYSPSFVNGGSTLSPIIPNYMLPEPRNNPVRDLFDNLTWTKGNHTFTFGGDFRSSTDFDTGIADPSGYYLGINSQDPAVGMFNPVNFPAMNFNQTNQQDLLNAENLYATLTGRINNIFYQNYVDSVTHKYQTLGAFKEDEAQKVGGLYFQDAWKVSKTFALNYGFRWQFSGAIHNTNDTYVNPDFANLLGPSTQLFQPGVLNGVQNPQLSLRPAPYSADLVEPAPNFGFAWNPDVENGFLGKLMGGMNTVIRGGASISYYDEGWTTFEQATIFTNPGATQNNSLNAGPPTNTPAGEFPAGSLSLGGTIPAVNSFPGSFTFPQPESDFTFANQPFATVDPNLKSPMVESWNVGIQRQLPGNTVLEINYVGNHSVHMWMNYDLNEVNIFGNGFLQDFQNAQTNYAASGGTTFAGSAPTPLLNQAFGTGSVNFTNPAFLSLIQSGQAAALANQIGANPTFFCNLVGNGGGAYSPCTNLGYGSGTAYPINIFQANPYATGQPITLLSDPGSESYNGLQTQVKHPVGHNLLFMANYAYSHSFTNRYIGDYYTADQAVGNFTTLRDRKLSRAPSPYDLRHVFHMYAIYQIPYTSQNGLLTRLLSEWSVSPIMTWQIGRNFKLLGGTNTYNYYDNYSNQPDVSDSGVVLNGITRQQLQKAVGYYPGPNNVTPILLMNPKVFSNGTNSTSGTVAPETTPGQLGQFIYLTGPQYINTDFAVTKVIKLHDALLLNIQAEMLNVFNHPAWSVVDGYSGGTNNPAQYVNLQNNPTVPGTQTNPEGLNSNGARDIQFRMQLVF